MTNRLVVSSNTKVQAPANGTRGTHSAQSRAVSIAPSYPSAGISAATPTTWRLSLKKCCVEGSKHTELNVITMKELIMTTTDTYSIVTAATVLIMIVTMAT